MRPTPFADSLQGLNFVGSRYRELQKPGVNAPASSENRTALLLLSLQRVNEAFQILGNNPNDTSPRTVNVGNEKERD